MVIRETKTGVEFEKLDSLTPKELHIREVQRLSIKKEEARMRFISPKDFGGKDPYFSHMEPVMAFEQLVIAEEVLKHRGREKYANEDAYHDAVEESRIARRDIGRAIRDRAPESLWGEVGQDVESFANATRELWRAINTPDVEYKVVFPHAV